MTDQQLDPSVEKFKHFINTYPLLCADIRSGHVDVQSLYEKWAILGEDDSYWDQYSDNTFNSSQEENTSRESTNTGVDKSDLMNTLLHAVQNMDMSKMQHYVEQVSSAVGSVQEVVTQFNETKNNTQQPNPKNNPENNFFTWMRD